MINDYIMDKTISTLKELAAADTVIGKPITAPDGATVIPVSKVSAGIVSGGGEYGAKSETSLLYPGAGAGGAGASITPLGFLVMKDSKQSFITVSKESGDKWKELTDAAINVFTSK